MGFTERALSFFKIKVSAGLSEDQRRLLLRQYYSSIQLRIEQFAKDGEEEKVAATGILAALAKDTESEEAASSWENVYAAEKRSATVLNDEALQSELNRRLEEAKLVLDGHYLEQFKAAEAVGERGAQEVAYLAVLNALHWHYAKREVSRDCRRFGKSIRLAVFAISALVSVAALYGPALFGKTTPELILAAAAGTMGASFSVLLRMNRLDSMDLESLKSVQKWREPWTRVCIGAVAGVVMYLMAFTPLAPSAVSDNRVSAKLIESIEGAAQARIEMFLHGEHVELVSDEAVEKTTESAVSLIRSLYEVSSQGGRLDIPLVVEGRLRGKVRASKGQWNQLTGDLQAIFEAGTSDVRGVAMLIVLAFMAGFVELLVPGLLESNASRITNL